MAARPSSSAEHAHSASHDELRARLHHPSQEVLAALLENPLLDEAGLLILLERKELPEALLEKIARQKEWMCSYRVKRGVARHPHTRPCWPFHWSGSCICLTWWSSACCRAVSPHANN